MIEYFYMKKSQYYSFRGIIEPDEDGGYHGFVPLLRGVHTFGDTFEEAKKNLQEATFCHLQGLLKDNETIPQEENAIELIQTFSEKELAMA